MVVWAWLVGQGGVLIISCEPALAGAAARDASVRDLTIRFHGVSDMELDGTAGSGNEPTGVQRIDEARQRYRFCLVMMVSHGWWQRRTALRSRSTEWAGWCRINPTRTTPLQANRRPRCSLRLGTGRRRRLGAG